MKKSLAEQQIKIYIHEWWAEARTAAANPQDPSFFEFKTWLRNKGLSHLFDFRSVAGAEEDVERWFSQEMRQSWRY